MDSLELLQKNVSLVEERLGHVFENKDLIALAFVHRSFVNEHRKEVRAHNERLEFLGDSILGLIVADFLYHRLPNEPEGRLSQIRSSIVEAKSCAYFLQKMGLQEFILLGRGEAMSEGKAKVSILADTFEAVLGAIFLDGGLELAKEFITAHFTKDMEAMLDAPSRNYKADFQDYAQKQFQMAPTYQVLKETGPDHAKTFHVAAFIDDKEMGHGVGESKKQAEQQAAFDALSKIQ